MCMPSGGPSETLRHLNIRKSGCVAESVRSLKMGDNSRKIPGQAQSIAKVRPEISGDVT